MLWVFFALLAPVCGGMVNVTDKYILENTYEIRMCILCGFLSWEFLALLFFFHLLIFLFLLFNIRFCFSPRAFVIFLAAFRISKPCPWKKQAVSTFGGGLFLFFLCFFLLFLLASVFPKMNILGLSFLCSALCLRQCI